MTVSINNNLNQRINMRCLAKKSITRLWVVSLFAVLSMFVVSAISLAVTPKIGDSYGGGTVFYVDGTGQHGLIAAKVDVTGHSYRKDEGFFNWYGAKDGANAFVEGYDDWFLPTKEQLNQLYSQRRAAGMANSVYWSSSEGDVDNAWAQNFASGEVLVGKKTNGSRVRAVRLF